IDTPCAVTDMKYSLGVPILAPSGLRTHICHAPSTHANRKAPNPTQRCARQSRSTLRTGDPPIRTWFELISRQHLDGRPHLAVALAAKLVAGHKQIARARELGVYLRDKPRHDHGVDIRPRDQKTVDNIRRGESQRDAPIGRDRNALRDEHELRGDGADDDGIVAEYGRSQVLLGKFSREMQRLGIDPLHITWWVDADRERGEHDHA